MHSAMYVIQLFPILHYRANVENSNQAVFNALLDVPVKLDVSSEGSLLCTGWRPAWGHTHPFCALLSSADLRLPTGLQSPLPSSWRSSLWLKVLPEPLSLPYEATKSNLQPPYQKAKL